MTKLRKAQIEVPTLYTAEFFVGLFIGFLIGGLMGVFLL